MQVPFADLGRATAVMRGELAAAADRVLDSGWYVLGAEGRAFEEEFAAELGAPAAAGVANGTDAIELALRALGIGPGDDVVTQANTCIPTISGIERAGATPVLCDVEREAGTIDPASLEQALTPATRAIIPVHLYGQCGDMDAVRSLAADRGIPVVEDCAQAHLASYEGATAGTMGDAGAFSFYPTKNLGALGDGGGVTGDEELVERVRLLRMYGQAGRYEHVAHGVNSRLDELQAALLRAKLTHLHDWHARRNAIARAYDDALAGRSVRPLAKLPDREHAYHLYVAVTEDRERFQTAMTDAGVGTLVHYPRPVHGHEPYRALGEGVPLSNAEWLADRVVSLPLYPELTDAEVEYVCDVLSRVA